VRVCATTSNLISIGSAQRVQAISQGQYLEFA
jgi:hypothetical protein